MCELDYKFLLQIFYLLQIFQPVTWQLWNLNCRAELYIVVRCVKGWNFLHLMWVSTFHSGMGCNIWLGQALPLSYNVASHWFVIVKFRDAMIIFPFLSILPLLNINQKMNLCVWNIKIWHNQPGIRGLASKNNNSSWWEKSQKVKKCQKKTTKHCLRNSFYRETLKVLSPISDYWGKLAWYYLRNTIEPQRTHSALTNKNQQVWTSLDLFQPENSFYRETLRKLNENKKVYNKIQKLNSGMMT